MKVMGWICMVLIIIGALNWGMIGFFQIDIVGVIFGGQMSVISRIVYALVGLAGIWGFSFFRLLNYLNGGGKPSGS